MELLKEIQDRKSSRAIHIAVSTRGKPKKECQRDIRGYFSIFLGKEVKKTRMLQKNNFQPLVLLALRWKSELPHSTVDNAQTYSNYMCCKVIGGGG